MRSGLDASLRAWVSVIACSGAGQGVLVAVYVVALLSLSASGVCALQLVRGPYLQQGTPTTMIVHWRTDLAADTVLHFGPSTTNLSTTLSLSAAVTEHEISVQGLDPDTKYYYSIGSSTEILAGPDNDHYFVTSPPVGSRRSTRLWVIGDSGENNPASRQVRDEYLDFTASRPADVWLMLGDNAYLIGSDAEYTNALFNLFPTILRNTVLWPSPGNHDFTVVPESSNPVTQVGPYFDAFTLPKQGEAGGVPSGTETYYSFDYANIHFVSLNTYNMPIAAGSAVQTWLAADLAATDQDWQIVYMHFPPYSKGSRNSDTDIHMRNVRTLFNPVFEAHGVDLVMTGHSHSYERSVLIDGHYGIASTLIPANILDGGDGDPAGDGPYVKPSLGPVPHSGTVYVVNGVGANALEGGGPLDHPVMITGFELEGSMVIDIDGSTLDAVFVSRYGDILDRFRIVKGTAVPVGSKALLILLVLALAGFVGVVQWRSARRPSLSAP